MLFMRQLVFLVFLSSTLSAQDNLSVFDAYMKAETKLYGFNGNVLVAKGGQIIYQNSFGYANYTTRTLLDRNSVFDCGSIAKEFTAMGILLLKDKGLISYSDSLRKFFPQLPYMNVTIQQLLTHTSGMPNGFALVEEYFDHSKTATNNDLIGLLASKKPPLLFQPGENLMYSGTAFNMLASIIEKISGQSYENYMYKEVFKPLGLTHTRVATGTRSTKKIPGLAAGYEYSDSLRRYVSTDSIESGWRDYFAGITGEGMIVTTTGDLLKWDRALKNHKLLTETTQREMLSVHAQKKFPSVSFGYGIIIGKNDFGDFVYHNGSFPGYLSMHLRYTDDDLTVIVLSNNESQADFIAEGLSAIALNKTIAMPYRHQELTNNTVSSRYTGKYTMALTRPPHTAVFPVEFVNRNNVLFIHSAFGPDLELKPESDKKFFFANGTDQQIEFESGMNGNVSKVWHTAWGVRKEMVKVE
jgi:CubicO group peptidase (beta-lactamase class C family)